MTFDAGAEAMMARSACSDVVRGLSHDELTMVLQRAYEAGRLAALAEAEKAIREQGTRGDVPVENVLDAIARLRKGAP